jgi:hypothetical protein
MKLRSLTTLAFPFVAGVSILAAEPLQRDAAKRHPKLTGLLHNEDCINFFDHRSFPQGKAGEMVDRYVDVLAGAGVGVLM